MRDITQITNVTGITRKGGAGVQYLQDITFNPTTSLYEDALGNMTPVVTGVPVANFTVANGDYITLANEVRIESGDTLEFWMKPTAVATGVSQCVCGNYQTSPTRASMIMLDSLNAKHIWLYAVKTDSLTYDYRIFAFTDNFVAGRFVKLTLSITNNSATLTRSDTGESKTVTFSYNIYLSLGKIGTYAANLYFGGNILGIKKNGVLIANLQEFSGSKIFSPAGAVIGTWSGTGSRYTRVDGIPTPHQAADIKRVTYAGGTAYVPATVSDATINANFTTVTLIEILSGLYKDDGSRMNLHPTTNNNPAGNGQTISEYLNSIETSSGIDLNSYEAGEDLPTAYKHTIVADKSTTEIKLKKP